MESQSLVSLNEIEFETAPLVDPDEIDISECNILPEDVDGRQSHGFNVFD